MTLAELLDPGDQKVPLHFPEERAQFDLGDLLDRSRSFSAWNPDNTPVGMVLSNTCACVTVLFGAILAGNTVASIPLPPRGASLTWYSEFVKTVGKQVQASTIIVDADLLPLLPKLIGLTFVSYQDVLSVAGHARIDPEGFALIQFTSGSTSDPRGVILSQGAIASNIESILKRLDVGDGDIACSWLPLSHDMGLIGMFLAAVAGSGPRWSRRGGVVLMTPQGFLRRPGDWLKLCSDYGATITSSPNFALELAASRGIPESLDLKALRVCIVGAEPVRPLSLERFAGSFAQSGFRSEAFCPAYGLAEATLAVTIGDPDTHWTDCSLDPTLLANNQVAPDPSNGTRIVSTGRPLDGVELRIASSKEGAVGEICVRGPSVAPSYSSGDPIVDEEEWLHSSDLGFMKDGRLYVVGRKDDVLIIQARKIYAPDVEAVVSELPTIRTGRTVVALNDSDQLIVFAEIEGSDIGSGECQQIVADVRRVVRERVNIAPSVELVARGSLPMTASGKTRRHRVCLDFVEGNLPTLSRVARSGITSSEAGA
jgi:acyl-CoA synthetase (AMP-forming)/AMP-acid ligase II